MRRDWTERLRDWGIGYAVGALVMALLVWVFSGCVLVRPWAPSGVTSSKLPTTPTPQQILVDGQFDGVRPQVFVAAHRNTGFLRVHNFPLERPTLLHCRELLSRTVPTHAMTQR